ncbi:hypothetical protein JS528_09270 [Bifidobacterium sp. MA2]|uniref:DUF5648 domain-containing protein n=1 Tax=Bifidobacterium santillanense TaxID=2809028 RepID=A0ABS5URT0_9BIFI|nr:hypothetical protein [Bifidobacterium santillanense]MBT1173525.1 hypothetical protein [Bifidobacterium santillanense]
MKHFGKAFVAFAAAAGIAVAGVPAANAAFVPENSPNTFANYSISNVKVSDIGSDSATVTFNWKITMYEGYITPDGMGGGYRPIAFNPAYVKSVCAVADISRVTDITPIANDSTTDWGSTIATWPEDYVCGSSGTDRALHERDLNLPKSHEANSGTFLAAKYSGQSFWQADNGAQWDGKSGSGTFSVKLTGLTPGTTYGNNLDNIDSSYTDPLYWTYNKFDALWRDGVKTKTAVDLRSARVGLHVDLKSGTPVSDYNESNKSEINKLAFDFTPGAIPDFTTLKAGETKPDKPTPSSHAVVYRAFNPNETRGGSHLYTTSKAEYNKVIQAGWRGEGPQFEASSNEKDTPVYRLYNPNDGSHHYTLSAKERDALVRAGWRSENVAWYVAADATTPVYRVYNPNTGEHVFTVSKPEASAAVKAGWHDEGTAFNAYLAQ